MPEPERHREINAAIQNLLTAMRLNPDLGDARAYWATELAALAREASQDPHDDEDVS